MSDPFPPSGPRDPRTRAGAVDPDRTVLAPTRPGAVPMPPASGAPADDDRTVARTWKAAAATAAAAPAPVTSSSNVLPPGTRLAEFEITGVIGEGGFGIVYRAFDHALQRVIALKEYMPGALAARQSDASVVVKSDQHRETFEVGLKSFINEARLLAQFDHPALVKVLRFWAERGTAYMAMPLYEGATLKAALKAMPAPPDEAWLRKLLVPLLDAIDLLHKANCLHRDIAPDNVLLVEGKGGSRQPVLLDFGAARRVIGEQTQALTVILKPGFAPIEQYDEIPGMKQGAWTDLYALGAVMHFAITGKAPAPSVGRMMRDAMVPLAEAAQGRYSPAFLAAIDRMLAPLPDARVQSVAELRALRGGTAVAPRPAVDGADAASPAADAPAADAVALPPTTRARTVAATRAQPVPAAVTKAPMRWGRVVIGGLALGGAVIVGLSALVSFNARQTEQQGQQAAQAMAEPPRPAPVPTPLRTEPPATPAVAEPAPAPVAPAGAATAVPAAGAPGASGAAAVKAGSSPAPASTASTPRSGAPSAPTPAAGGGARPASASAPAAAPTPSTAGASAAPTKAPSPLLPSPTSAALAAATNPAGVTPAAPADPDDAPNAPPEVRAALRDARLCLASNRYDCTIERAQAVLRTDLNNLPAQRLLRQARENQERALQSDWKMR